MNKYRGNEYWDMVKISNDDKEYPSNMGQKWTDEEESLLLVIYNNIYKINQLNVNIIIYRNKKYIQNILQYVIVINI